MRIDGRLQLVLRLGEEPDHVPAHVDVLIGAGRPQPRIDDGKVDRALRRAGGFRATNVYHARSSIFRAGMQHVGYASDEHTLGLSRTLRVELRDVEHTDDVIAALRDLAVVEAVRAETLAFTTELSEPTKDSLPHDVARTIVRASEALQIEPGDERVTVAIVDSGVAIGHAELQRKLLAGYDTVDIGLGGIEGLELVGDSRGVDFNPRDEVGHGTHVAGIVGAQGFRVPRGLGGRSLVLPLRVLAAAVPPSGGKRVGVGALSDIDCGIKIAVDLGAKVLNMSFGTAESAMGSHAPLPHTEVVAYAMRAGCILVAAAGNSGKRERFFPAAHPDVIAVGAVGDDLSPSSFSTRGTHVAIAAPGERILSLGLKGTQPRLSTGTSHASPFVAAAAALLVARARRVGRELRAADVRTILTQSAKRTSADAESVGAGVLDAAAALRRLEREMHA